MKTATAPKKAAKKPVSRAKKTSTSQKDQEAQELAILKKRLDALEKEKAEIQKKAEKEREEREEEDIKEGLLDDLVVQLPKTNQYKELNAELKRICTPKKTNITLNVKLILDPADANVTVCDGWMRLSDVLYEKPELKRFKTEGKKLMKAWSAKAEAFVDDALKKAIEERKISKIVNDTERAQALEEIMYFMFYEQYE